MEKKVNKSGESYPVFKKQKKRRTKASIVFLVIAIIFFVCAIGSLAIVLKELHEQDKEISENKAITASVTEDSGLKGDGSSAKIKFNGKNQSKISLPGGFKIEYVNGIDKNLLRKIDFSKLKRINPDVNCWLYLPGTGINSYVMKEEKVEQYFYLWRNIYRHRNKYGSYLTPKIPGDRPDAHKLIFGHRTFGSWGDVVFAKLPEHTGSKTAIEKHPYFYIYYPDHAERWRIWAPVDAHDNDKVYEIPYDIGSNDYYNLLKHIEHKARFLYGPNPTRYDHTMVLSTCNSAVNEGIRYFVVLAPDVKYNYGSDSMETFN